MTREEKLKEIAEALEMDVEELNEKLILSDIETWDSVAVLSIIAIMNEKFDKYPSSKEILECKTVGDLMNIMSK